MFDKVQSVSRQHDKNYLRPGRYLLRVEEVATGIDRKKVENWRWGAQVVAVLDSDEGKGHKVGENVKRLRKDTQDGSLPEFKAFVCTMFECEDEAVTPEDCAEITGPAQPLSGAVMEVRAYQVETKASTPQKPALFTVCDYVRRVPDAEIAAAVGPEIYAKFFTAPTA
jgi:hypothetical protein